MRRELPLAWVSIVLVACGSEGGVELPEVPAVGAETAGPIVVETRPVESRQVRPRIVAVGTAQPIRAADIGPQMSARIVAIEVEEGDSVSAGDVLVRLDARADQLGASQAASSAQGAAAQVRQLEQELERLRPLAERGTIPSQQVEQMELQLEAMRAQASAAATGAARASTAARHGVVRAPFSGTVARILMEVGETATMVPSTTIVRIVDLSTVEIRARVAERELARLDAGLAASVHFPALGQAFEGTLARIAPEIDPLTRTVELIIHVQNPEGRIRGGMSAEISIQPEGGRTVVVLPPDATRGLGESRRLFLVSEGHAEARTVRVSPLDDGSLEVLEGIGAGETVIAPLGTRVRDGAPVVTSPADVRSSDERADEDGAPSAT